MDQAVELGRRKVDHHEQAEFRAGPTMDSVADNMKREDSYVDTIVPTVAPVTGDIATPLGPVNAAARVEGTGLAPEDLLMPELPKRRFEGVGYGLEDLNRGPTV